MPNLRLSKVYLIVMLLAGALMIGLALTANQLGLSEHHGFGWKKLCVAVVGAIVLLLAVFGRPEKRERLFFVLLGGAGLGLFGLGLASYHLHLGNSGHLGWSRAALLLTGLAMTILGTDLACHRRALARDLTVALVCGGFAIVWLALVASRFGLKHNDFPSKQTVLLGAGLLLLTAGLLLFSSIRLQLTLLGSTLATELAAELSIRPGLRASATQRKTSSRFFSIDRPMFVLFALPLVLLYADKGWLFSSFGYIDSWIYSGYFLDLPKHLQTFSGAYFSTRLSWLLPGFLAYHFLPPLVALHLLHLFFYELAVLSLYLILKQTLTQRPALLTAALMGTYSFFLWAIGWDYVDGIGISYLLLTMLALTYAAKSPRFALWLISAGMAYACLIHSQLFLGTFTPVLTIYYLFVNRSYLKHPRILSLLFFTLGALTLTCILGIINLGLTGQFLFFLPSFRFATTYVSQPNPWRASSYMWIFSAASLVLPAVVLITSLVFLLLRGVSKAAREAEGYPLLFQLCFIVSILTLAAWGLVGQPLLQFPHYASYLIPTMFLAIGSQLRSAIMELTPRRFYLLLGVSVSILIFPFFLPWNTSLPLYVAKHGFVYPILLGFSGLLLLTGRFKHGNIPAVVLLCSACATFNMNLGTRGWRKEPVLGKDAYLAVVESVQTVRDVDPGATVLFWYDFNTRPLGDVYRSVSSAYLWAYRLFSENFPLLDESRRKPALNMKIVILSNDKQAFKQADESLNKMGFAARLLVERTITRGRITYDMIFIDVVRPLEKPPLT